MGTELQAAQWDWQILCWMSWEMGNSTWLLLEDAQSPFVLLLSVSAEGQARAVSVGKATAHSQLQRVMQHRVYSLALNVWNPPGIILLVGE